MNEEQLKIIVGLIAGLELAVVHVCNVLDQKGISGREDFADSFEATATGIPQGVANRQVLALPLMQIAQALRNSRTLDGSKGIEALFH